MVSRALAAHYYAQRAGAGLLITEAAQVSPQGVSYPATPGIHSAGQAAAWRKVTEAVHRAGSRIFIQLVHGGRISHPSLLPGGASPVAPSAIAAAGSAMTAAGPAPFPMPRALDDAELPGIVREFAEATRHARDAGFDGVELHAANGYLLDQFLRSSTNQRAGGYGGSAANRSRLIVEVAEAASSVWAPQNVGVRVSPHSAFNDISDADPPATFGTLADLLAPLGLAYLHLVEPITEVTAGRIAPLAWLLQTAFDGPLIQAGGFTATTAAATLRSGPAELIAFGTPFIANPDLPERFRRFAPLSSPDRATFYGGDARGYTDYPTLDAAYEPALQP